MTFVLLSTVRKMNIKKLGHFIIHILLLIQEQYSFPLRKEVEDIHDICSFNNEHVYNLDENRSFQLSVQSSDNENSKMTLHKLKKRCGFIVKVCPSCHISITIRNMTIPSCSKNCSCNYFEITEPLSENSQRQYCGFERNSLYYQSQTKTVNVDFVQSVHMMFYVTITFNASRNLFMLAEDSTSNPLFIETPNFPMGYPSDYGAEYIFQAKFPIGIVRLLFIDFQLSKYSSIEITGHNGTYTAIYNGDDPRPPAIISQGPMLKMRFQANDRPSGRGFRAQLNFGRKNGENVLERPQTDCGGLIEGFGGAVNMTKPSEGLFDCIWLIHPPLFTQRSFLLSVKIVEFSAVGPDSAVRVRQGLTSKSSLLRTYYSSNDTSPARKQEVITPAEYGIYVRFQGSMIRASILNLAYIVYHETLSCSSDEYLCSNGLCIKNILVCDGYANCINGSDEMSCTPGHVNQSFKNEVVNKAPSVTKFYNKGFDYPTFLYVVGAFGIAVLFLVAKLTITTRYEVRREREAINLIQRNENHELQAPVNTGVTHEMGMVFERCCDFFDDCPPSYEEFTSFNDRYPPLFYTRGVHQRKASLHSTQDQLNTEFRNNSFCIASVLLPMNSIQENFCCENRAYVKKVGRSTSLDLKTIQPPSYSKLICSFSSSMPDIPSYIM